MNDFTQSPEGNVGRAGRLDDMVRAKIGEQIIAVHSLGERNIGLPQPACKTRRQHARRCGHQNRLDMRIASATHGGNDCPRYIVTTTLPARMATSAELGIPYLWPCASHH